MTSFYEGAETGCGNPEFSPPTAKRSACRCNLLISAFMISTCGEEERDVIKELEVSFPCFQENKNWVQLNTFTMTKICTHYVRKRFSFACNWILIIMEHLRPKTLSHYYSRSKSDSKGPLDWSPNSRILAKSRLHKTRQTSQKMLQKKFLLLPKEVKEQDACWEERLKETVFHFLFVLF